MKDLFYDSLDAKIIIGLGRAYRSAQRRSSKMFYDYGLTVPQFTVLEVLYSRGDLKVKEIVDKAFSSGGNMTVVIRNLELQGLIYRRENPDDRRSYLIGITDVGRSLMDFVFPLHMENMKEAFSCLDKEEKEDMIRMLKTISDVAEGTDR